MRNYKVFIKVVNDLEPGKVFFVNAINISENSIKELRKFIQNGVLKPVESELKKAIVPSAIPDFMTGESICPQMHYIKN